jgi:cytochrome c oxidase subunit 3
MSRRIEFVGDVSHLKDYAFGTAALGWWACFGFMLIEGMAFVLAIGVYFYLMPFEQHWPPAGPPPDLRYGTAFTILMALSLVPNHLAIRAAQRMDLRGVKIMLSIMIAIGLVLLVIRGFEYTTLNERWDANAYGSILWAIMIIHTIHLATDFYDSLPLAAVVFFKPVDGRKFSDVEDNAVYWWFVAASWFVLYTIIYWVPRMVS